MTEHDVTRPCWGHNVSVDMQDREAGILGGSCWLSPGLKEGDTLILNGTDGPIRFTVYESEWVTAVDDMYHFKAVLEGMPIPKVEAESPLLERARTLLRNIFSR